MSKFKITPHDTKEFHCRQALKAFDPLCIITIDKEDLVVETSKLELPTIKSFTSVKEVTNFDNELVINWTYTPTALININPRPLISGNNLNTVLNSNPNNTCLPFSEVKTKIRNLLNSHLAHINFSSEINLFDNISNTGYIIPSTEPNSRVIDILHSNNDTYDRNNCYVYCYAGHLLLSFDGSLFAPMGTIRKNVVDVYESISGIVTIVYV